MHSGQSQVPKLILGVRIRVQVTMVFIGSPFIESKTETFAFILQFLKFLLIFLSNTVAIFHDHVSYVTEDFGTSNPRAKSDFRNSIDLMKILNGKPSPAIIRVSTASRELS